MVKLRKRARRLTDAYAFPGFRPQATVRGVFGDSKARIVTLVRRSKKQCAEFVGRYIEVGTIHARAGCAICRAATRGSTWSWKSDAWTVGTAAR